MFAPAAARLIRIASCAALIVAGHRSAAGAQTQYRNLDAGHPGRVEDAVASGRYTLDVDLAPFQVERLAGGTMRYRAEPKVSYGVMPFTEIELRAPFVQVNPPSSSGLRPVAGLAGLSLGMMRTLNLETTMPAIALSADVLVPTGNIAPSRPSFMIKALATRSTSAGRVHLNVGIGTFAVRSPPAADSACFVLGDPATTCTGGPPIIIDMPCAKAPYQPGRLSTVRSRACMPTLAESTTVASPRLNGARWIAGLGVDHAFALSSTLFTADVVAERFVGLYATVDWTAEVGVRRQLTPVVVVDLGVARHFAGAVRSTSIVVGATYEFATPPVFGR